jgi:prophage regulatory protein
MAGHLLVPLPGIGTLSLTRAEYEAALILVVPPDQPKPAPERRTEPIAASMDNKATIPRAMQTLRLREVSRRIGLSRSAIYKWSWRENSPRPVKLLARTSAWIEYEVDAFMIARIVERDRRASEYGSPASPYMRMGEVMNRTGLSHAMIYSGVRNGTFPKWSDRPKRASEWLKTDIEA